MAKKLTDILNKPFSKGKKSNVLDVAPQGYQPDEASSKQRDFLKTQTVDVADEPYENDFEGGVKEFDREANRFGYKNVAFDKFDRNPPEGGRVASEEVEINELSKKTLASYIKKASGVEIGTAPNIHDIRDDRKEAVRQHGQKSTEYKKAFLKTVKRNAGIRKAVDKLAGNKTPSPYEALRREDVQYAVETLGADATAKDYIHDFVHSKNAKFKGDSRKERIKRALGAFYHKEEVEQKTVSEGGTYESSNATDANIQNPVIKTAKKVEKKK